MKRDKSHLIFLKKFFLNYIDMILFMGIITIKVLSYGKEISPEFFSWNYIFLPVFASVVIISSVGFLFKQRRRYRYYYIVNILISIIIISDLLYFRYYKDIISIGAIRNAFLLGGVGSSVASLFKLRDIFYVLDILVLIPFYIKIKKRKICESKISIRLLVSTLILVLGIFLDSSSINKLSIAQPGLLHTMSNRIYITKVLGNINFHAIDAYQFIKTQITNGKRLPQEEEDQIKKYFQNESKPKGDKFKGYGKNKNLIVIQVEALQQFVINSKIEGEEITPNLNKFLKKSLYFDNYFYQVAAGNTSDAEFLSNNSLYPASSGAAYYMYSGNEFNSIGKALSDKGYYTAALHGYKNGFWNRNIMYKAEKFQDFFGETNYKLDERVGLGLSDKSFLNQSLEKMDKFKTPFYSFLVTLSSHFPYDDVKGYGNFNVGKYEGKFIGNYLKGIHYTDQQLGMFLSKLEEKGYLQNSIIMLYGDHNAIPKNYIEQLYDFVGEKDANDLKWFELQKVPMMIHFPDEKIKGINHMYSGQIDLYPTIANLYNLPRKYMLGVDLLNSKEDTVIFRNGSFTDGKVFYISWTGDYYDVKTGCKIKETPFFEKKKALVMQELNYCDKLLDHNLIKRFEGKK